MLANRCTSTQTESYIPTTSPSSPSSSSSSSSSQSSSSSSFSASFSAPSPDISVDQSRVTSSLESDVANKRIAYGPDETSNDEGCRIRDVQNGSSASVDLDVFSPSDRNKSRINEAFGFPYAYNNVKPNVAKTYSDNDSSYHTSTMLSTEQIRRLEFHRSETQPIMECNVESIVKRRSAKTEVMAKIGEVLELCARTGTSDEQEDIMYEMIAQLEKMKEDRNIIKKAVYTDSLLAPIASQSRSHQMPSIQYPVVDGGYSRMSSVDEERYSATSAMDDGGYSRPVPYRVQNSTRATSNTLNSITKSTLYPLMIDLTVGSTCKEEPMTPPLPSRPPLLQKHALTSADRGEEPHSSVSDTMPLNLSMQRPKSQETHKVFSSWSPPRGTESYYDGPKPCLINSTEKPGAYQQSEQMEKFVIPYSTSYLSSNVPVSGVHLDQTYPQQPQFLSSPLSTAPSVGPLYYYVRVPQPIDSQHRFPNSFSSIHTLGSNEFITSSGIQNQTFVQGYAFPTNGGSCFSGNGHNGMEILVPASSFASHHSSVESVGAASPQVLVI